ncbi:ankyrin repeat domain-containing protein [Acerihabitans sp. TG2]|uniref:ankyrin repeat domain-containing protein n=1 Tax=Acerihabitans sp. TG2 TaxID=3096008 RepID=UPI002B237EED|nr:ankyrin repeat domain-containing protein [Acerihabitans sp. TG2]MEA9389122.1 ankyrin repeat domain-containing protein [Acerihabitans sp. TG2]
MPLISASIIPLASQSVVQFTLEPNSTIGQRFNSASNIAYSRQAALAAIEKKLPKNIVDEIKVRNAREIKGEPSHKVADLPYRGNKDCNLSRDMGVIDYHSSFKPFEQEIISSVKYLETLPWENVGDCYGNLEIIKMVASSATDNDHLTKMIATYGMIINTPMYNNNTLLHFAAKNGFSPTVKTLIQFGAHINVKDVNGLTPMHWASRQANVNVVKLLIKGKASINSQGISYAGAHVNQKDNQGLTALHWAAKGEARETADEYSMHIVINDLREIANSLINNNADINQQDNKGFTALHWAVMTNFTEMATLLIEKDADLNIVDKQGHTALNHAKHHKNQQIIDLITNKLTTITANNRLGAPRPTTRPSAAVSAPSHQLSMSSAASRAMPWPAHRLFSSSITSVFSSIEQGMQRLKQLLS